MCTKRLLEMVRAWQETDREDAYALAVSVAQAQKESDASLMESSGYPELAVTIIESE